MKNSKPVMPFAPHEIRVFIRPLSLAAILLLVVIILGAWLERSPMYPFPMGYGILGIIYITISNLLIVRTTFRRLSFAAINVVVCGIGLGLLAYLIPENLRESTNALIIIGIIATLMVSGRYYAYATILLAMMITLRDKFFVLTNVHEFLDLFIPFFISAIILEVVVQVNNTTQQHIRQLETINAVSRQLMKSLDPQRTFTLLDQTIRDALVADSYFIGILTGNDIVLDLFYDDGEYFNGIRTPIEGSLSGWVIKNQKVLFLPDLREDVHMDGIQVRIQGKEKTSLAWMGVPLKAENVTGVLALASYTANAFDRADLELLINLGQHVTLALDNAIRHAQVEKQAQLDSLTGVYNHGHFLKVLTEQTQNASNTNTPLSLIMLDIDHFKQYNDTYGHLVGDRVLNSLCTAIQQNIKQTDAVGRWGGEEFVISLPGANGKQAMQIAARIGETMKRLRVEDRNQNTVPIPTVSQGIAVYPVDANEVYRLIDVADNRLYTAKARGRNQIEPTEDSWE